MSLRHRNSSHQCKILFLDRCKREVSSNKVYSHISNRKQSFKHFFGTNFISFYWIILHPIQFLNRFIVEKLEIMKYIGVNIFLMPTILRSTTYISIVLHHSIWVVIPSPVVSMFASEPSEYEISAKYNVTLSQRPPNECWEMISKLSSRI